MPAPIRSLRDSQSLDAPVYLAFSATARLWHRSVSRARRSSSGMPGPVTWSRTIKGHSGPSIALPSALLGVHLGFGKAADNTIRLWDINRDQDARKRATEIVQDVAFGHDGSYLRFRRPGQEGHTLDLATGQIVRIRGRRRCDRGRCDQSDGRAVSGGADKIVHIWDVATGNGDSSAPRGLRPTNPRCRVQPRRQTTASASDDRMIKLFTTSTGNMIKPLEGHLGSAVHSPVQHGRQDSLLPAWTMDS